MKKQPAQPNQSLIQGIACLQAVINAEGAIGSRETARRLDEEHTRVNRLLGTLCSLGLLEQTPDRRYQPGPGIHVLAAQSLDASGLLRAALPVLRKIKSPRLSLALGVLWNDAVSYFFFRDPAGDTDSSISGRKAYPAQDSSIGRVIAAWRKTESPQNNPFLSQREAVKIRKQGYALVSQKPGHASIAVGIGSPVFAGLALAGDSVPTTLIPALVKDLTDAAQEITLKLQPKERAI